jgi:type II secretory pathway component HofQ
VVASAAAALAGCKPRAATLDEAAPPHQAQGQVESKQEVTSVSVPATADSSVLLIRELKIIDDNGQQGVFAKLSRPPQEVTHVLLSSPNRLMIEGPTRWVRTSLPSARGAEPDGRAGAGRQRRRQIRLTSCSGDTAPTYTVNDLNDSVVAFLGEPRGTAEPVRESIVFTQRAVPGAAPAPAPVAAPAVAAAAPLQAPSGYKSKPLPVPPVVQPGFSYETADAPQAVRKAYYGQPISLDLKDADVHNVIRLLADVSGLNIVATDDVKGTITLRLNDIPWDQALDIILQTQNLESVQEGNVVRISTVRRLREEREELQKAQRAAQTVEPLQVAYIQVNYAKAKKLGELVNGSARAGQEGRGRGRGESQEEEGVLTARGSVMVDEFTNTLIVRHRPRRPQRPRAGASTCRSRRC